MLGHVVLEHQLALFALRVEHTQGLALGQRLAHTQYPGFQGRVVAVIGAVAGEEVLDQTGQGVDFKCIVGNQHTSLNGWVPAMLLRRAPCCQSQVFCPTRLSTEGTRVSLSICVSCSS